MSSRLSLLVAGLGVVALAACDASSDDVTDGLDDTDRVSGVWEATVPFSVDTVLAEHNYRIKADYDVHVRFDVLHDDGLAWGTVTAAFDGTLIAREAGTLADTFRLDPAQTEIVTDAYGTYIRPTLELDVPFGPYTEDLWTFEKVASRLDLQNRIVHTWRFVQRNVAEADTFEYELPMAPTTLSVSRVSGEVPNVPEPTIPTQIPGSPGEGNLITVPGRRHNAILRAMGVRQ